MPKKKSRTASRKLTTKRIDMRDVAKRAGVSIASVSRTINRMPSVDARIAKRVWAAVEELGYIPNTQARALVSGRSRLFGVIISDITNPFFPELIQNFEEVAVPSGYEILIGSTAYDSARMEVCIQRMLERKVDGVAVMTFGIEEPLLDRMAKQGIPLVFIDIAPDSPLMSTIKVDYVAGIQQAVQHLAVLGHRKIAFIAGPPRLHSATMRRDAFMKALRHIGIQPTQGYMAQGDHTLEGGMKAAEEFFRLKDVPTAIMCSNDVTAIGVMHAAARAGLRIPEDISVIGFDDIHFARYMFPPLTSVQMSCRELARAAFDALKKHVEAEDGSQPGTYHVTTTLTVRQTTDVPRNSLSDLKRNKAKRIS